MTSCKFRYYNSQTYVIALLNVVEANTNNQMVLTQFDNSNGQLKFAKILSTTQLDSSFYNNIYIGYHATSALTPSTIFITGKQSDNTNSLFIQKVDATATDAS